MRPLIKTLNLDDEYFTDEQCHIIELSNSADDPDLSIARARVAPSVTTHWHHLLDTTERYVILEGRGRVEIGDLAAVEVTPGDVVLIPPGCRQRISNTGDCDLIFLALCTPRFEASAYVDTEEA